MPAYRFCAPTRLLLLPLTSLALILAWWEQRKWRWWCETGSNGKGLESPSELEGCWENFSVKNRKVWR